MPGVFGRGLENVDSQWTKCNARSIMNTCSVPYVKDAKLHGMLFNKERFAEYGAVSCADTEFFVDHEESDRALQVIRGNGIEWPFGLLPEGHEYLALVSVGESLAVQAANRRLTRPLELSRLLQEA
jgi:hypothetical protein